MTCTESDDVHVTESGCGHALTALCHGKLEALLSFEKHCETTEKRPSLHAVVIDYGFENDQRATRR